MVSVFALYAKPEDEQEFLDHYVQVHAPLARSLPGILSLNWGQPAPLFQEDDSGWFLIAEMRFSDRDQALAALTSEAGRKAGKDLASFAKGLVTMRMVEWHE